MRFFPFIESGSSFFLEIACNDSLQKCVTSSRAKIHEGILGPKFGQKETKSCRKLGFLPFSQVCFISFP